MEIFLWLIVYLAFVLPVTKCLSVSSGMKLTDCFGFAVLWPISVPAICFFETLGWLVRKLVAKSAYLIEN